MLELHVKNISSRAILRVCLQSVQLCQVLSGAHKAYHCHHVCHFQIVCIKCFAIEELFVLRKNLPNAQRICAFRSGPLAACQLVCIRLSSEENQVD
jgi:hypothetical protein